MNSELIDAIGEVAGHYRCGRNGAAAEGLVTLVDGLMETIQQATLPAAQMNRLAALLNELFAAQQRHDTLYLADLLEYRLRPLLE